MKSVPTMKDIADELEITVMSVSKALSGKEGVSDELRAKIISKAEEIGYKKASSSKETSSKNIGILVAARSLNANATFMSIQQSLISQLSQVDYYGLTEIISEETEHLLIEPKLIKEKKVDGFIILGQMEKSYLDLLKKINLPKVLM
ncbi:MAG: LacI family DNA-binding transcriptional regulator, partial [Treponema sp.]|nr:LacI family DNA-binding transcriptional regulator [Treponema sp.]